MSKVEQFEEQVKQFTSDELRLFRDWFAQFDAEIWDQQIEADIQSGKLADIAQRALADHNSSRSTVL